MYKELNKRFSGGVFMLAKKNVQNVEFLGTGFWSPIWDTF
jgi:hypothetical protein